MVTRLLKHQAVKYTVGMAVVIIAFSQFVACGSQLYKVNVQEDFDHERAAVANPEVNDPKSTKYGIHSPYGWQTIPIPFRFGELLNDEQKLHLMAAIKMWEWAVGKQLFTYKGIHNEVSADTFEDLYESLNDDVNGNYMERNWAKTEKPNFVIATTVWTNSASTGEIQHSDIHFNEEYYLIGDSLLLNSEDDRVVVDMQSLALHELGHLLGLAHVSEEVDEHSVMNPTLFIGEGLTYRLLSESDIERIQTVYGCEGVACDVNQLLEQIESREYEKEIMQAARAWLKSGNDQILTMTKH